MLHTNFMVYRFKKTKEKLKYKLYELISFIKFNGETKHEMRVQIAWINTLINVL